MVDVWLPLQLYLKWFWCCIVIYDTDSLTYEIKSEDVYGSIVQIHLLHFSEYQSKIFDHTNKKVNGKMKDERHFI